jgi:hypothetical protein
VAPALLLHCFPHRTVVGDVPPCAAPLSFHLQKLELVVGLRYTQLHKPNVAQMLPASIGDSDTEGKPNSGYATLKAVVASWLVYGVPLVDELKAIVSQDPEDRKERHDMRHFLRLPLQSRSRMVRSFIAWSGSADGGTRVLGFTSLRCVGTGLL